MMSLIIALIKIFLWYWGFASREPSDPQLPTPSTRWSKWREHLHSAFEMIEEINNGALDGSVDKVMTVCLF